MTATLPAALIPAFRALLQATQRDRALGRWEAAFACAVKRSDADALECVHRFLNALYCQGKAASVQGLVNDVEREISAYWDAMRMSALALGESVRAGVEGRG